ncbi:DUF2207 domain-containing protein [Lapillicoccus jejuensis]|uniref:Putative membrane protein DUF2207 n=1 Tax=Lapillicoccus jejuensis TaxID=402171 RepID=A0A542DVR6_9MICO|nr:DUF2207 domain-containing protein [Lapillicoccus jejuensis]TQJ07192.1 putative membrane protein DUF2207 [Lapillicoccus jejuensis]
MTRARALLAVVGAALLLLLLPATGTAAAVGSVGSAASGEDRMSDVAVDIVLDAEGGATFTERITYVFGPGEHHGIFRSVVTRQAVEGSDVDTYRYYDLSDVTASSPTGAAADVAVQDEGSVQRIRVGDADRTVDGTQQYVVRYHLAHVMNAFSDHVELFYNVFKDDSVPKDRLSISVSGPSGTSVTQARCTLGQGEGTPCATQDAGTTARFAATDVASGEDVTIATSLPRTGFGTITPDLRQGTSGYSPQQAKVLSGLALGGGVLVPLLALGLMGTLVATRGRDERYAGLTPGLTPGSPAATGATGPAPVVRGGAAPVVAVQFTPPAGVQPGMVGVLWDESADTVDVSATVIDLAVRGYLRIEETSRGGAFSRTDWELTRLVPDPAQPPLTRYESTVLEGLFATSNPVRLSDLKYHFASTLGAAKREMYDEVVQRGWFRRSPQSQRAGWQALGFVLIGAGVVSLFALGAATYAIDRSGGFDLGVPSGVVLGVGLILAGVVFRVLGKRMAARTAEGSAVTAQALGFKEYLETAEADQIRFEEAQSVFSRYLPYAIVFGCADRWARTFQQVAEAAAAAGQPLLMPSWYLWSGGGFPDFTRIADGAGDFASSANGTFAATATSGSSGGSGFGGGSFGGGGVGGSSSGSW